MGLIHAELTLQNLLRPDVGPVTARALADSGATLSCVPESVAVQLELDLNGAHRRSIVMADGHMREVAYVGPLMFRFKNRQSMGGALVMGDEVVLGAVQMEDMDVVLFPQKRLLDVNPAHPEQAVVRA